MQCYICKKPATATCQRCGHFMCNAHQATNPEFEDGAKIICPHCDYELNNMPKVTPPQVIYIENSTPCKQCGGSGQIGGLLRRRDCPRCGGSGKEPDDI